MQCHIARPSKQNASTTLEEVNACNVEAFSIGADISNPKQLEELIKTVMDRIGGVDILYNHAALMCKWKDSFDFSNEEWYELSDVNVFAPARLCAAFIPGMKECGIERIITVSPGIANTPQLVPYGASKCAVDKLTAELAHGLKGNKRRRKDRRSGVDQDGHGRRRSRQRDRIRHPGYVDSRFFDRNGPSGRKFETQDFKHLSLPPTHA